MYMQATDQWGSNGFVIRCTRSNEAHLFLKHFHIPFDGLIFICFDLCVLLLCPGSSLMPTQWCISCDGFGYFVSRAAPIGFSGHLSAANLAHYMHFPMGFSNLRKGKQFPFCPGALRSSGCACRVEHGPAAVA